MYHILIYKLNNIKFDPLNFQENKEDMIAEAKMPRYQILKYDVIM